MLQFLARSTCQRLGAFVLAAAAWLCAGGQAMAGPQEPALKVTLRGGQFGVIDARGATRVPFIYDVIEPSGSGLFIVGLKGPKTPVSRRHFGVVDGRGRVIVPPVWAGIEHNTRHRRFEVSSADLKQGVLDEKGQVVVPAEYDRLDRISNMGDEPTVIAMRGGKSGYLNIVTGKMMIPVVYDALRIGSLDTDPDGEGLAVASLRGRWGVLATDGSVVVPFDFDSIAELDVHEGSAMAEREGRLVRLDLRGGRFNGTTEVPTRYSSDFVPRPGSAATAPAGDGLYAAEDYPTMREAWDAQRRGQLHWVAIPSLQLEGDRAHVAFGQFRDAGLPATPNTMAARRDGNRIVLTDEDQTVADRKPFLTFTRGDGVLVCHECPVMGLPTRWRLVPPPQPFGGIGIGFAKESAQHPLRVTGVVAGGPAQQGGLAVDDIIVRVNNLDMAGATADSAREALRGPTGSTVQLQVERDGKPLPKPLSIERKLIVLQR